MRFFQIAITGLLVAFVTSAAPTSFRPTKYVNQIDKYSTAVRSSDPSLDGPSKPNDPQYFAPFDGIDETEEMEDPPVYETNGLIPLEGYTLKEKRNSLFTIAKPIVALAGSSLALEEQYHYQGKPILHEVLDRNMRAEGNSMSQSRARECSTNESIDTLSEPAHEKSTWLSTGQCKKVVHGKMGMTRNGHRQAHLGA